MRFAAGLTLLVAGGAGLALAGAERPGHSQPAPSEAVAPHPVAVELFTSQGCSSCPPADVVQAKLAKQADVIAITRPVTYWDRLGWRDTLASPANTALQRAYAERKISGAGVYTPQSVIQGTSGFVGGRESKIRGEIVRLSRTPEPALTISTLPNGGRSVQIDGAAKDARVSVVALRSSVEVSVGGGENIGRKLVYANALVSETVLGRWKGGAHAFTVPRAMLTVDSADRYALIVREGRAGPILVARYL